MTTELIPLATKSRVLDRGRRWCLVVVLGDDEISIPVSPDSPGGRDGILWGFKSGVLLRKHAGCCRCLTRRQLNFWKRLPAGARDDRNLEC